MHRDGVIVGWVGVWEGRCKWLEKWGFGSRVMDRCTAVQLYMIRFMSRGQGGGLWGQDGKGMVMRRV